MDAIAFGLGLADGWRLKRHSRTLGHAGDVSLGSYDATARTRYSLSFASPRELAWAGLEVERTAQI
jgi:hypothetical protein